MSSDSEQCTSETKVPTVVAVMSDISRVLDWSGKKIRVYGTADEPWFHATDLAKALGYTNTTDGVGHAKPHQKRVGSDISRGSNSLPLDRYEKTAIFVNEGGVYAMIFKSKKKEAEAFQDWVTDEVLPSIRKTGAYNMNEQFQRLTSELSAQRLLVNNAANIVEEQKTLAEEARMKAEAEQKRADDARAEVERIRQEKEAADLRHKEEVAALELSSLKVREGFKEQMNQRNEHVYVFTSDKNKSSDLYKVGRTKNHPDGRVATLNTALPANESMYIVSTYACADAHSAEDRIHKLLVPFRDSPNREFFRIPFRSLHTVITDVIDDQDKEYKRACILIDDIIGRPGAFGKDADEYMAAIAATNAASIIPIVTNEMLAQEAITTWIATLETPPEKFDWIKFQVFLRSFLEARRRYSKATYRAREWKDMSTAAFTRATNPR